MYKKISVKSSRGNYSVEFIDNFKTNILKNFNSNQIFIIDQKIYNIEKKFFDKKKIKNKSVIIKANEISKSFKKFDKYANLLIDLQIDKNSEINLIGGGVIQDIGSFLSSILFRGIKYNFYPTTLLSQADSCIGSKTSINLNKYKNLIGNFWPPKNIFIDFNFIKTLDLPSIKSGIGEMCHYFIYSDINLFVNFMSDYEKILNNHSNIYKYIPASLKIKKNVIQKDEFDTNERRKFNYGHTFGHALEALTDYKINHGQAVTLGMDFANYISFKNDDISKKNYYLINGLLKKNFPSHNLDNYSLKKYISILQKDKKNIDGMLGCILLNKKLKMNLVYKKFDNKLNNLILIYFNFKK